MPAAELPEAVALVAALPVAVTLVERPEVAARWGKPSELAGYTVGGLAGHLVRAVERTVVTLDLDVPAGAPVGPEHWFLDNRVGDPVVELDEGWNKWLRDDGETLAADGPATIATALAAHAAAIAERLAVEPADRDVAVLRTNEPATLRSYLATRVVEVVVHSDDLAVSARLPAPAFDGHVVDIVVATLVGLARARSGDVDVIRALTRAERLADPYDVLRVL